MEEKLVSEMNEFLSASSGTDDGDLPFEPLDAFSTEPVEFSEMAGDMLDKVENLFDLTRLYNRHSVKYLKAFALLEKGIRFLGSACVTKYAMGAHDYAFPELSQMTTQKLYRMASFNYRKLNTALTEKLQQQNDLYQELTDAFMRCFTLLNRLRATERKIHNWFSRKYFAQEDFAPVIEGVAFSKKSWTKDYTSNKEEAPAFRSAPAYPIMMNSEFRNQNSEAGKTGAGAEIKLMSESRREKKEVIRNRKPEIKNTEDPVSEALPEAGQPELKALPEPKVLPEPAEACGTEKSPVTDNGSAKENETGKKTEETETTEKQENKYADQKNPAAAEIPDDPGSAEVAERTPLNTEPPPCIGIVQKAMSRGPATEYGGISFTNSEILALAEDPSLEVIFPEMVPWIHQTAEMLRM